MSRILSLAALLCTLCAAAQTTYTNPVYDIDFPDPSVQRGQDGYWYAYSTGQKGARSTNLFKWTQLSNVISRPTWNDSTYIDSNGNKKTDYYSFWACDVNYVDGKYLMLYACALWGNGSRTGIGEPVEDGLSHTELQQKAALWGVPWHSDSTAGNGYPILQWQFSRGDYRQTCGFPIIDAIERVTGVPTPSVIYDLQGRRVGDAQDETTKLPKGIYIVNGRKVVK